MKVFYNIGINLFGYSIGIEHTFKVQSALLASRLKNNIKLLNHNHASQNSKSEVLKKTLSALLPNSESSCIDILKPLYISMSMFRFIMSYLIKIQDEF